MVSLQREGDGAASSKFIKLSNNEEVCDYASKNTFDRLQEAEELPGVEGEVKIIAVTTGGDVYSMVDSCDQVFQTWKEGFGRQAVLRREILRVSAEHRDQIILREGERHDRVRLDL